MALIVLPNTFLPYTTISSTAMNENFTAIIGQVNGNLDSANISSVNANLVNAGAFENGGYSFPGTLTVAGSMGAINVTSLSATEQIQAASDGVTESYVPPMYTPAGVAVANTAKIVLGSVSWSGSLAPGASTAVAIPRTTGAAIFAGVPALSINVSSLGGTLVPYTFFFVSITNWTYVQGSGGDIFFTNTSASQTLESATFVYALVGV
jgi:hypothetical protein